MNNMERRDAGLPYIVDQAVFAEMMETRKLVHKFNLLDPDDTDGLDGLIRRIIGKVGSNCSINQPFYCDYGKHIILGDNFYANYNCTILDVATVTIGNNVFFAPNVSIYTAGHPLHHEARNSMYEYGIPVTIGNNVWIGGNTVVVPGVNIGDNTVIGAGSVVTKDVPSGVIAAGNPCRVIRKITGEDKKYYYKNKTFDRESWNEINHDFENL